MMRKVLSLAVICGLAAPAMAAADEHDTTVVKETTTTVEGGVVTTTETIVEEVEVEQPEIEAEEPEAVVPVVVEPLPSAGIEPGIEAPMTGDNVEYVAPEEHHEHPFLDGLDWMLMASAFYNFNGYRVSGPYNDVNPAPGVDERTNYPYTNYMGFGLNFAGGMASYTGEKWGVTVDLRFGEGANLLTPLVPVKQGYVSWYPSEKLFLDVGFFDTIFGAEVADEWENANYTRGALYFLRQPFNHMGARFGVGGDTVGFTLMLTNGGVLGGTPIDGNEVPAVGWQLAFTPGDVFGLYVGGNHGPNGNNGNKDWESFFDFVLSVSAGDMFTLLLNGDYQVDKNGSDAFGNSGKLFQHGHSLALMIDPVEKFGIGLRGEYLSGNDNYRQWGDVDDTFDSFFGTLWTATLTLRYRPVEYLTLSLEGRLEGSQEDIYYTRDSREEPDEDFYGAVILGFSGHIGN